MIKLGPFFGRIPGRDPKFLPAGYANVATNCDLSTGVLTPIANSAGSSAAAKAGALRSIFLIDGVWMTWTSHVHAILSELANSDHKFYWTGDSYPKQATKTQATSGAPSTYPTTTRRLGVIPPDTALTMQNFHAIGTDPIGSVVDAVSYYYTYVTADGEESSPSPETAVIEVHENEGLDLVGFVAPSIATSGNDVTHYRVYRLSAGTSGTAEYQLIRFTETGGVPVYDMPVSETTFEDEDTTNNTLKESSGEVCPTEGWDPPPNDMDSLQRYSSGVMVGRSGNTICFSEPGIPSAWPSAYQRVVAGEFVAMAALKETVLVSTTNSLYAFYGSDPANIQKVHLTDDQPCVSPFGMLAVHGESAYYPSADGLVIHNGIHGTTLSGLFTKDQWRALGPENMFMVAYDSKLHVFIRGTSTGFIVTIPVGEDDLASLVDVSVTGTIWDAHVDPVTNAIYILVEDEGVYYIQDLNNGSGVRSMVYESAEFQLPNFCPGYARVRGDQSTGTPITVKTYNDDELIDNISVADEEVFSLSPIYAGDMHIRLEGTTKVDSVIIAASPEGI
jgi:hypothetical protein